MIQSIKSEQSALKLDLLAHDDPETIKILFELTGKTIDDIPLNDSVEWISAVWKYKGDFETEINLIIKGEITKKFYVDSSYYRSIKQNYRSVVFDAVNLYN